jgi:hypothetical protein
MLAAGCDASDRLESKVKRSSSGRQAAPAAAAPRRARAPGAALLLRGRRPRAAQDGGCDTIRCWPQGAAAA